MNRNFPELPGQEKILRLDFRDFFHTAADGNAGNNGRGGYKDGTVSAGGSDFKYTRDQR